MQQNVLSNLAMEAVWRGRSQGNESELKLLAKIAEVSPSPEFSSWLFAGRAWTAGTIEELVSFHDGGQLHSWAVDTVNMLSLDDLAAFADEVRLPDDQHRMLVTVIVGRAFVLGRSDVARRYLGELRALFPDQTTGIDEALIGSGGDKVQIARAILTLPRPTVWMRFHQSKDSGYYLTGGRSFFRDIDLPAHFVNGGVLNRNFRKFLAVPFYPERWYGLRRADRRGRIYDEREAQSFIPDDWRYDGGLPFLRLIAWDELGEFDVCHGLTDRLSEAVIRWADDSSDGWLDSIFTDEELVAETLRRIIILNKRSPGALVDGKPAGQVAMWLLETRFADTQAARATRYWYFEDQGCRN
jgi:hypothetical protein